MTATMAFGAIYPTRGQAAQENTNPPQAMRGTGAQTPGGSTKAPWNVPALSNVAATAGMSVPALIALGVMAWFLFNQYE